MRRERGGNGTLSTIGKILFLIMLCVLSLSLSISVASCKVHPARKAGAAYGTGEAKASAAGSGRTLSTFNEIITVVVLIGGAIFGAYCLRASKATRRDSGRRRNGSSARK
jgi:amino acid transporter